MSKDGKLHASGDLERRVREWWNGGKMNSNIDAIYVLGDGGVRVEWSDPTESGHYFINGETLYAPKQH